jgi:hypothetical protein
MGFKEIGQDVANKIACQTKIKLQGKNRGWQSNQYSTTIDKPAKSSSSSSASSRRQHAVDLQLLYNRQLCSDNFDQCS